MFSIKVLLSVVAVSVSLNVVAQSTKAEVSPNNWLMAKYDENGDHVISLNEINKKRKSYYAVMDRDQDGLLSFSEYQKVDMLKRQSALAGQFKRLDLNKDGVVNSKEYSAYQGDFDRLDLNNDGQITSSEMQSKSLSNKSILKEARATKCLLWFCIRGSVK